MLEAVVAEARECRYWEVNLPSAGLVAIDVAVPKTSDFTSRSSSSMSALDTSGSLERLMLLRSVLAGFTCRSLPDEAMERVVVEVALLLRRNLDRACWIRVLILLIASDQRRRLASSRAASSAVGVRGAMEPRRTSQARAGGAAAGRSYGAVGAARYRRLQRLSGS
jgi:hypothetical protein